MSAGNRITEMSPERATPEEMAGRLMESEHRGRYLWAAQMAEGREVLDAGCGTGYGTEILAEAGARHVVGVDISQDAIEHAQSSSARSAGEFVIGDLHQLPFDDATFDLTVCFEAIEHVEDQQLAISELRRVLRQTGVLAISSPNRNVYPPGNSHHTHEFTPDELERALLSEFANVRLYRQSPWLTAAVLDDEQSSGVGVEAALALRAIKIAAVEPGEEVFTVALASNAELPTPEALALLGEPFEVRWWESRFDQAVREREDEREARERELLAHAREREARERELLAHAREREKRRRKQLVHDQAYKDHGRVLLAAETELAEAQNQIARLRDAEIELKQWARERDERLRQCDEERRDFENRLHQAENTIDDITGSLSWHITWPLRGVMRSLRAVKQRLHH